MKRKLVGIDVKLKILRQINSKKNVGIAKKVWDFCVHLHIILSQSKDIEWESFFNHTSPNVRRFKEEILIF